MKTLYLFSLSILLTLTSSCQQEKEQIHFHASHYKTKQNVPFSDVVEANGFLFLSGQIGMDHNTRTLVEGGIEAETQKVITNIKEVLTHHNSSLDKVVKCTVVLKNIEDFSTFNSIYVKHFKNKPARTTFAASGLARNALIEIEVIAVK